MYLLGIDIGTTHWKAVLYDYAGNAVAQSATATVTHYGEGGQATYDAQEIWQGICGLIQDILAQCRKQRRTPAFHPTDIAGVAMTGMGEAIVPVDAQARPLYPVIAWFDSRTEPQYRWLKEQYGSQYLFNITGVPLVPIYSLSKLLWIREHAPEVFQKADKWLTMPDWIMFRLTGVYATEYSEATRTMCFDITRKQWSEEILRILGIDTAKFPPAYPSATIIGQVHQQASEATGLAVGTPVVTGGHDHICGALAVGVFEEGLILDSCGTSESLMLTLNNVELTEALCQNDITLGFHVAREKYYMIAGLYTSGIIIRWFQEQFAPDMLDENGLKQLMFAASNIAPGAEGLFFLPHLRGANTAPVDPLSRGAFLGIQSHHTRNHFLRAIIEGVCYEVRRMLEGMKRHAGIPLNQLRVIGGASNAFWLQVKADVLNQPLEVPAVTEATSLGAALLAGIGVGVYRDEQDAFQQVYRPGQIYTPNPEHVAQYEECYQRIFTSMYPTLAPLHHNIAAL